MTIILDEPELVRLRHDLEQRLTVFLREEVERRFAPWYDQLASQLRELAGKRAKQIAEIEAGANLRAFVEQEIKARIGAQVDRSLVAIEREVVRARRLANDERLAGFARRLNILSNALDTLTQEVHSRRKPKAKSKRRKSSISTSIDELSLSTRSANALTNAGIRTIGDLITKTEAELLCEPNFGRRSLDEVKTQLAQMGLHLGMGR